MPQRSGYDGVFISDTDGTPLIGLNIAVYNSSGTTLSTIYEGKNSSAIKDNPFVTSSGNGGLVKFWVNPGYYEIEVSDPSFNRIGTRRVPFDAVAGDAITGNEGISLDQIPQIPLTKIPEIPESQIQNAAITTSKINTSSNWVETGTVTYPSGWVGSINLKRYYPHNLVSVSSSSLGIMNSYVNQTGSTVNLSNGQNMATIPVGYRPVSTQSVPAWFSLITDAGTSWVSCRVNVSSSSGGISLQMNNTSSLSIANNGIFITYFNLSYPAVV